MKFLAILISASFILAPASLAKESPRRIVSTSLCGDSYLKALADPENIAALSWQSRTLLSDASEPLKALPQARDDAETLLALEPDLIVFGPGEGRKSAPFLKAAGIESFSLQWGEDFGAIADNLRALQQALGKSAKKAISSDVSHAMPKDDAPTVLYLSRSGGTAGPGTLVNAAIEAAGGINIITETGWRPAQPEHLITLQPDLIVTSYFNDGLESAQSKAIRNRAMQNLIKRSQSVEVPGKYWPCAGPGLYKATEIIKTALDGRPK